jgi:hypothetical protein
MDTVGGVESHAAVDATSEARPERFPAASTASTPNADDVPHGIAVNVNEGVVDVPTATPSR